MSAEYREIVQECVAILSSASQEVRRKTDLTQHEAFQAWRRAAYEEPGFLYDGDYIGMYRACREKRLEGLSLEEVRTCITFDLRQMRCEYAPYSCIVKGELASLLRRYLELTEVEG